MASTFGDTEAHREEKAEVQRIHEMKLAPVTPLWRINLLCEQHELYTKDELVGLIQKVIRESGHLLGAAQPKQEPVVWEDMPETRRLLKTITAGVECGIDGNLVTIFISDESDPSVGLDGGLRLSLSCNYEVIPLSLLNDIKQAMGDNWERCMDLWRQTHEVSSLPSTDREGK